MALPGTRFGFLAKIPGSYNLEAKKLPGPQAPAPPPPVISANKLWFALGIPPLQPNLVITKSVLTANLDIPAIAVSGSITGRPVLNFALEIPVPTIAASIKSGGKLSAALQIPAIKLFFQIAPQTRFSAALRIPALRLSESLRSGGVLSGTIGVPPLSLSATFAYQNQLRFAVDVPFIDPWLEIRGTPALVPVRKGFVMNLSHSGVTEYDNYPFNSFCEYRGTGVYIGASEDGIFLLDGNDDNGVRINAIVATGTEDLWAGVMKRLREGFVSMRGGEISLQLVLDEGRLDPVTRDLQSVTHVMHEERFKTPRGLKNRFVSFIIRNCDGSDFDLESLRIFCDLIQRRKR